ncbi:hypothetical protein PF008_g20847 [Phytophthora fragariae]|uniref:Reverse transcriptase domain-containing protein n=1 Tax=Phytophthora fragariae TaxID=53985 RepID=A0A6G0QZD3_9STRA|nr:hypothetical protein PF008_g20847 [Phytophthora fragariae]
MLKRRRQAQTEDAIIEDNVGKMLQAGVIEEGNGAWGFPVVLVRKKDGEVRFCVDYRALNKVTKKDVYPLPRIDETLEALGGALLFTTLDLHSGYWQIGVSPEDRDKTAFTTKQGLYRFLRMPFCLMNAPSTFQRMMNGVLRGLTWTTCLVYLNDIVVFTRGDVRKHLVQLAAVLEILSVAGLTLKLRKCVFAARSMEYLGHELSDEGVRPVERLITAVTEFPRPSNTFEVKRFVHLAGYYRKFIEAFGSIMAPMTRLLKKDCEWQWTEEQEFAFERVKAALTTKPLLVYPNFGHPFRLVTDASQIGLGACLMQDQGRGWQPIAFASKVNNDAEANYSIAELECLAVVWSVKLFRPYLYGRTFEIVTDHAALKWLMTRPNLAGRMHRWSLTLQEYDFQILYRPGTTNVVADALSRAPAAVLAAVGRERIRWPGERRVWDGEDEAKTENHELPTTKAVLAAEQYARQLTGRPQAVTIPEDAATTVANATIGGDTEVVGGSATTEAIGTAADETRPSLTRPRTRAARRRAEAEAALQGRNGQQLAVDESGDGDHGDATRARRVTWAESLSEIPSLGVGSTPTTPVGAAAKASEKAMRAKRSGVAADKRLPSGGPEARTEVAAEVGDDGDEQGPEPTLQVTDDELIRAQRRSRWVQRVVRDGSYTDMVVENKYGLVVIHTKRGRRVILPPALWPAVFKEMHGSIWASTRSSYVRPGGATLLVARIAARSERLGERLPRMRQSQGSSA